MHLARLWLDPRSGQARRDLANPYDMHRTLVRAFVTDETDVPPRFLWRAEPLSASTEPAVLVQSAQAGRWSVLDAIPGYLKRPVETRFVTPEQLLQRDARYRFRLFANPTVTRDGKRYGLVSEAAQLAWLTRQGERLGFSVEAVVVTGSDLVNSRKTSMQISLQRACFEGVLRAVNVETLAGALLAGIGPGKAFGCGLLSVARY